MRCLAFFRDPLCCCPVSGCFFGGRFFCSSFCRFCLAGCLVQRCDPGRFGLIGCGFFSGSFLGRRLLGKRLFRKCLFSEQLFGRFLFFGRLQLCRTLFFRLALRLLRGGLRGFGLLSGAPRREGRFPFRRCLRGGLALQLDPVQHGLVGNGFVDFRRLGGGALLDGPCGSDLFGGRLFCHGALDGKTGSIGLGDVARHGGRATCEFVFPGAPVGTRRARARGRSGRGRAEDTVGGSAESRGVERAGALLVFRRRRRRYRADWIHRHGTTRRQQVPDR